ncbi:MAG: DUF2953 domain-containing protein [Candidatus Marinimicrobia bacterium]|nr:DUF2953 domain-containing protein [Candidatus Neomarinimicrobiota bacterium]MBL7010505.1 DUF2953 domain-containing protein [Candidatus Neomarinimicrobiota bacterium]MBL7030874.1 DUF2953 domain-containing protein [Candidatus Neomarinimicrobiota bacterium]
MVLNIILWSLTALIAALLLIMFIPYRLAVSGNIQWIAKHKSGNTDIRLGGLNYGILISPFPSTQIGIGRFDKPLFSFSFPKKSKSKTKKHKPKKKNKLTIPYLKIGKATLKGIHFDQFSLVGDLGLPNPMHTGLVYGWSQSMAGVIRSKKIDIDINPQFNNRFETDMKGYFRLKFIPGKVLWQAIKTYFKFRKGKE